MRMICTVVLLLAACRSGPGQWAPDTSRRDTSADARDGSVEAPTDDSADVDAASDQGAQDAPVDASVDVPDAMPDAGSDASTDAHPTCQCADESAECTAHPEWADDLCAGLWLEILSVWHYSEPVAFAPLCSAPGRALGDPYLPVTVQQCQVVLGARPADYAAGCWRGVEELARCPGYR